MNDRIRKKTKVAVAIADRKNPLPKCEKLALPTLRANPKYPVHRACIVLDGLNNSKLIAFMIEREREWKVRLNATPNPLGHYSSIGSPSSLSCESPTTMVSGSTSEAALTGRSVGFSSQ